MFSEESWLECIAESINAGGFAYVSSSNTAAENFSRPLHIFFSRLSLHSSLENIRKIQTYLKIR